MHKSRHSNCAKYRMNKRVFLIVLIVLFFVGCSEEPGEPVVSENETSSEISEEPSEPEEEIDPKSFLTFEEITALGYYPIWMKPNTVIIYDENGNEVPKIKISENPEKITYPHFKKLYRLYEKESGKAAADLLCVHDEEPDFTKPYELFDPDYTWKRKTLTDYTAKELQVRIFENGNCVYTSPDINEIRKYCAEQLETLWEEVTRFENPHNYYVDLSQKLWDIKKALLDKNGK